jgi:hypothetical protein
MAESFTVRNLRALAHVDKLPINDNLLICQVQNAYRTSKRSIAQQLVFPLETTPTAG